MFVSRIIAAGSNTQGQILTRLFVCKPLVVLLGIAFSGSAWAADSWSSGRLCRAPSAAHAAQTDTQPDKDDTPLPADATRITADKAAGQTHTRHRAEGNVVVERNDETLKADWVDYRPQQDTVQAGDHFVLTRGDGAQVQGERLDYDLAQKSGNAEQVEFAAEQDGRRLQGVGSSLHMENDRRYTMRDVKFNTCGEGDTSWYVQAAELNADRKTGIGVARHARLVFAGVPILYTPWADFPLNGNRKSGFLMPYVSFGSNGATLKLPYYFNLAPNYDATFTPGVISRRGVQLSGEFRYLQPKFQGSLQAAYMPYDNASRHNHRYEIQLRHQHRFTPQITGGIHFNQVSDDDYYRDFYGRNDIAENVNLNRSLWLNYTGNAWGGDVQAAFLVRKYQTLADSNGYRSAPYALMPHLSLDWQRHWRNATIHWKNQLTRFESDRAQNGTRLVMYPSIQWDFSTLWGYIRPKIGVHATQYWLNRWQGNPRQSVNRVLPIANIDTGLTFERERTWFKTPLIQTLEPRLFYNYIPSRHQNHLPNFDSSENSFSYDQLFRENLYSGSDRINAANSVSLGVQSRILHADTGSEIFRAGIGQKFYLSRDDVLLDGSTGTRARHRSDVALFAGGQIAPNWFADTQYHWNANQKNTERFDIGVRYNPEPGKILSARYKYNRNTEIYAGFFGKLQHIDLAAQYPINQNLYAVGRLNYSISPWVALEQTLGLEYKNPCGCWSVSFVGQRYVDGISNGRSSHKSAVFLTLQLKNLSNIGNNPYEQLRLGIPGYSKTNEVFTR